MKFKDIQTEEKVRLDPKCWTGKKIGNPKTKMKGGVRVNNCVPAESVSEGLGNIGNKIKAVYQLISDQGDDAIEFMYYDSPIFAQYWDEYEGDLDSIIAEVDPSELQIILDELESAADQQGVAEDFNAEYDDEAGMAQGSLHTLQNAVAGLQDVIDSGDNLPEWCQEKISLAEDYLVTVWDYIQSEKAQGIDPEIEEMYQAMESLAEEMAHNNQVSVDLVWESFEALPDNVLYETAAWRRKEGKSKTGGLNAKGVASYRRENPGSKLQTAVTTKPSKLKPGSKAAKRRKSFCARMSGVKGPMKKPNGKPTRKALALRKWNC